MLYPTELQAPRYASNTYHWFWRRERTGYHPKLSPGGRPGRRRCKIPSRAMKRRVQNLSQVATNLYRSDASGRYYGIFKIRGKQIRRSLKTDDPDLARRLVDDLRRKVTNLSVEDGRKLRFAEHDAQRTLIGGLAEKWIDNS